MGATGTVRAAAKQPELTIVAMKTGSSGDGTRESGFGKDQLRAVGHRLRFLRESRNWSLKELAARSGVSIAAIQKIETGAANTSLMTVFALSEALGEPMDRLVRASLLEARATKVVHVAMPKRPANGLNLTGPLADPRMHAHLVVLKTSESRSFNAAPDTSPMFVYAMEGTITVKFADGQVDALAPGDAMHLSLPEHMTWSNDSGKLAQLLCVTDPRKQAEPQRGGVFA